MLLIAAGVLAGAALGAAITWHFGRNSRVLAGQVSETQEQMAKLEDEFTRWEFVRHLAPHAYLFGEPPAKQQVVLEGEESFRVTSVDFLTGSGRAVAHQELSLEGKRVLHPIDDQFIRGVLRLESNPWDGSGVIQLRFRTRLGDLEKDVLLSLSVVPEIKLGPAGRMEEFRRLVDPRNLPTSMHSTMVQ